MRIDLSANLAPDQSLDVWHASLPLNAAADIKTELAFDLQLNDKLVEIVTPAVHFIWPESGAFLKPVAIQFIYNCGFNCSPSAYSREGLLHMNMETWRASARAMELTSLRDQRFSDRLDFSLDDRQQHRPIDQEAQLMFHFDNGQQNIW